MKVESEESSAESEINRDYHYEDDLHMPVHQKYHMDGFQETHSHSLSKISYVYLNPSVIKKPMVNVHSI